VILRVDRGPAVELEPARSRGIAQEGERQLAILPGVLRASDHYATVGARQNLGLAVEVGRRRQQRPERRPAERPGRFLTDLIVEEGELLAIGNQQQVATRIFEPHAPRPLELQGALVGPAFGVAWGEFRVIVLTEPR